MIVEDPSGESMCTLTSAPALSFLTREGLGIKWKPLDFLRHASGFVVRHDVDQPLLVISAEL